LTFLFPTVCLGCRSSDAQPWRERERGREAEAGSGQPRQAVNARSIVGRSGSFPPPEFIDWELLDNRVGRLLQLFHATTIHT